MSKVNLTSQIRAIVSQTVKVGDMYNDKRAAGARRLKFISAANYNVRQKKKLLQKITARLQNLPITFEAKWDETNLASIRGPATYDYFAVIYSEVTA